MDMFDNTADEQTAMPPPAPAGDKQDAPLPEDERKLVLRILATVKADKKFHKKAFERMKRDMYIATHGAEDNWTESKYRANITGRHVKQKTAALYAKNPKAVAQRRETLDFVLWDENPATLQIAFQTVQQGTMMLQQQAADTQAGLVDPLAGATQDPMTGALVPAPPQTPPGFADAQALLQDFQAGMSRREQLKKFGRTLEVLFAQALREQQPLDFKSSMKQLVRRACTTSVGYVELGFQREHGPRPETVASLTDARTRLAHLKTLSEKAADGEITDADAEMAELRMSIAELQAEPEILLREGMIFDFPVSTKVIPDKLCKSLVGFVGAGHVTIEYDYTKEQVRDTFDVDLGDKFKPYTVEGEQGFMTDSEEPELNLNGDNQRNGNQLTRVYKHYDKPSGLVYYVCEGYDKFLKAPAAPDVFVSDFWPVYALTFNAVESESELFPPSDVELLLDPQREHNRSRQGLREHREAARPRWAFTNGALSDEDVMALKDAKAFDAIGLDKDPQTKLADVLETMPVPGVDPNLYETNQFLTDAQLIVGAQEAQLGGTGGGTATESAIAADSSATSDGSSVDDLDAFLSRIARGSGQILIREMSAVQVKKIVGPGAVWPDVPLADLADEIFLEVAAGSTGKPNQAVEIRNWKELLPFLLQMGSIPPDWLARETLRRLDDRMDLTEAVVSGIPSIVAQNQNAQPATGNPATDPAQQGGMGAGNALAAPGGPVGSSAPMGNNHM